MTITWVSYIADSVLLERIYPISQSFSNNEIELLVSWKKVTLTTTKTLQEMFIVTGTCAKSQILMQRRKAPVLPNTVLNLPWSNGSFFTNKIRHQNAQIITIIRTQLVAFNKNVQTANRQCTCEERQICSTMQHRRADHHTVFVRLDADALIDAHHSLSIMNAPKTWNFSCHFGILWHASGAKCRITQ